VALAGADIDTATASSGMESLEKLEQFQPDVVLLDIGMPGINGFDLCKRLRPHPNAQDAILVAHTGFADEASQAKAKAAGFDHFLMKPAQWPELERFLNAIGEPGTNGFVIDAETRTYPDA